MSLFAWTLLVACDGGASTEPAAPPAPAAAEAPAPEPTKPALPETEQPPEGASVAFDGLEDGAKVSSPLKIQMLVTGMEIQKAGELKAGTGHHHLIIDDDPPPHGVAVPADDTHIHFGGGQTEAEVELAAGEHRLTLQFADGLHRSFGPTMSTTITVTVE